MSYVSRHLNGKEKILFKGKIHWIIFFWPIVFTLIWFVFQLSAAWWLLLVWVWLYYLVSYLFAEVVITNQKIIAKYGMIAVESAAMELGRIESVQTSISILGRILGYGTVLVCGNGGKNIGIPRLVNPEKFKSELYQAIEQK